MDESPKNDKKLSSQYKMATLMNKLPELSQVLELVKKIGEGTFSSVYLGESLYLDEEGRRQKYAVKHLVPTCHPNRIVRELSCMQEIGGVDNVTGVDLCLRMNDCIVFIMPYQQHDSFSSYVFEMDVEETKVYIRELLVALRRVHMFSIIHRDVKPSNFLYCRKEKKFLLVDFGLAQKIGENTTENITQESKKRKRTDEENQDTTDAPSLKRPALQNLDSNIPIIKTKVDYTELLKRKQLRNAGYNDVINEKCFAKPNTPQNNSKGFIGKCNCDEKPQVCFNCLSRKSQAASRAGTPGFRPPEVLLKYPHQTTAVDIWAAGIIMLCIMSRSYPFFKSPDDLTALAEIMTLFGSERIKQVANKLGRNILCSETRKSLDLRTLCERLAEKKLTKMHTHTKNPNIVPVSLKYPDEAYDLLEKLLEVDPTQRITAEQALQHQFFC